MRVLALETLQAAVPLVLDLAAAGPQDPPRKVPPMGVVIHSPGRTWAASVRAKAPEPTDLEAVDYAAARAFDPREYRPGYLVGQSGAVCRLEADDHGTSHAGALSRLHYPDGWRAWARPLGREPVEIIRHGRDPRVVYDYWIERYGLGSPLDVFPWGRLPNRAIGIDLLPDPGGLFSPAQLASLAILIRLLTNALGSNHKLGFALDDRHVTTHSFAAPIERGSVWRTDRCIGTPWDPGGNFDLDAVLRAARA